MIGRLLAAVVTLVLAAVLLLACWPQLVGLEQALGAAQLVSLRGMAALVTVLIAVLFTLFALLSRHARRFLAGLAALLVVFAAVSTGVLLVRGTGNDAAPDRTDGDLVVLSWNTLGDAPGTDAIAQLAMDQQADVVALPETSHEAGVEIRDRMTASGHPMQLIDLQIDNIVKARSTVLLISSELGEYRLDDSAGTTPSLPSVVAVPVDGSGPTLIAAHPIAPVPIEMRRWSAGLDWIAERCTDPGTEVIVAGDLNSTLDHWSRYGSDAGLASCDDVARAVGAAAVGTWPTMLPPLLGSPIDHVLATRGWEPVDFRVIESEDTSGSDHRPVVATLRPTSAG